MKKQKTKPVRIFATPAQSDALQGAMSFDQTVQAPETLGQLKKMQQQRIARRVRFGIPLYQP